jgi:hypothetical protein
MEFDLSKIQTHVLDLPAAGRITYRVRFTQAGIFAVLEAGRRVEHRRERRALARWRDKIHRPLNADPRPMHIISMIAGQFSRLGIEENGNVLVFGEALP